MQVSETQLRAVCHPAERPRQDTLDAIVATAPAELPGTIETPLQAAMLFAQAAHETGGFRIREENMNYTAARIRQVWPSRPEAVQFAGNPRGLANNVYGSRMGNRPGTDDGWNFRGQGLAQHTGRDGFAAVGKIVGLPLVEQPHLVNDPRYMVRTLVGFWKWKRLGELVKTGDESEVIAVTKRWNGGRIGLADRLVRFRKARVAFAKPGETVPKPRTKPNANDVRVQAPGASGTAAGGGAVTTTTGAKEATAPAKTPEAIVATNVAFVLGLGLLIAGVVGLYVARRYLILEFQKAADIELVEAQAAERAKEDEA